MILCTGVDGLWTHTPKEAVQPTAQDVPKKGGIVHVHVRNLLLPSFYLHVPVINAVISYAEFWAKISPQGSEKARHISTSGL